MTGTRERRIPVKGVRKATAAAMVASAFTAPHVTEFLTIDVTPMMELRERLRQRPEFADVKLTPLAFAARAVCLAARRTPELNAVYEAGADGSDDQIVVKEYVNLGIAAATPRGLIVPVIQDADALDLAGLASALQELTGTARDGHTTLAADDRRHLHHHQRRCLRRRHRHPDHQSRVRRRSWPSARSRTRRGWSTASSPFARCASWRCRSITGWSTVSRARNSWPTSVRCWPIPGWRWPSRVGPDEGGATGEHRDRTEEPGDAGVGFQCRPLATS